MIINVISNDMIQVPVTRKIRIMDSMSYHGPRHRNLSDPIIRELTQVRFELSETRIDVSIIVRNKVTNVESDFMIGWIKVNSSRLNLVNLQELVESLGDKGIYRLLCMYDAEINQTVRGNRFSYHPDLINFTKLITSNK